MIIRFVIFLFFVLTYAQLWAEGSDSTKAPAFYYGDKGWHLESADKVYSTDIQLRLQFRYAYPYDQDPVTLNDVNIEEQHIFRISRARLKIGGHVFSPKFKYYMEYELSNSNLLDFWGMYSFHKSFKIMVGQYKARYNTERVISSGKQETLDRSILTRPFTIDRQTGITFLGNLAGEGALNFSYWAAVFSGTGQGDFVADDSYPMWKGRLQWNMFGSVMKFVGSDLEKSKSWRGYIAGGLVNNHSQFTRFSQSGGGQLEGYSDPSLPGQYHITQFFIESAFKKNGISWQQEFHKKNILDKETSNTRTLYGNYMQVGSFPSSYLPSFPSKLELAFRYAFYIPDSNQTDLKQTEYTFSTNWFFKEHLNKLTAEVSYFDMDEILGLNPGWRFRFQWDVSF
ncbi:porin [Reichenbachiella sp.]|uniref:porin n=1 Tax=Reichenbachiella sp. TaxID=2184521 RepID=UPI003BB11D23